MLQSFNERLLNEAFRTDKIPNVIKNITSFLSRNLSTPISKSYGDMESFKGGNGKGYGLVFYGGNGMKIRFNFTTNGVSDKVESISVWVSGDTPPDFNIVKLGNVSAVKYLPLLVSLIKNPSKAVGKYEVTDRSDFIKEDTYTDYRALNENYKVNTKDGKIREYKYASDAAKYMITFGSKKEDVIETLGISEGEYDKYAKKLGKLDYIVVTPGKNETTTTPQEEEAETMVDDEKITLDELFDDLADNTRLVIAGVIPGLMITGTPGTGKTYTVEETLKSAGLSDGNGYVLIRGNSSPMGIYIKMFKNRDSIIYFDDADALLKSSDGRNLMKGALDDKKLRKMSWESPSSMYDPADYDPTDPEDAAKIEELHSKGKYPSSFYFEGGAIFISNLDKKVIDPDGAVASRSMLMQISPSTMEMEERLRKVIVPNLFPDMDIAKKQECVDLISTRGELSARRLSKAIAIMGSGLPNWKNLVKRYTA